MVLHEKREVVEKCQQKLSEWLKEMGLELKPSKTRIAHSLNEFNGIAGFEFLGFNIRQFPVGKTHSGETSEGKRLGFKTIITPSKESVKRHLQELSEVIKQSKAAKQEDLIITLRPKIQGWANYFSAVCSKSTYSKVDHLLFNQLLAWARRRHPLKTLGWITDKYWQKNKGWRFAPKESSISLRKHSETPIKRHIKVEGKKSPYNGDWVYWSIRIGQYPTTTRRKAILLKRQRGICLRCGMYFRDGDLIEVDHIISKEFGGKDAYYNWQLLHRHCHHAKTTQERWYD